MSWITRRSMMVMVVTIGLLLAFSATQALAAGRTAKIIAGLAVGALVYKALSDNDHCDRGYYDSHPRYNPPDYGRGYSNSPRQTYNEGYRDGWNDGLDQGHREGYQYGYSNGYSDGRHDNRYYRGTYDYGPGRGHAYGRRW